LFPSPQGSLTITTTGDSTTGDLTGQYQAQDASLDIYDLIVSDSGYQKYYSFATRLLIMSPPTVICAASGALRRTSFILAGNVQGNKAWGWCCESCLRMVIRSEHVRAGCKRNIFL